MTPHPLPGHHGRHGRSPFRILATLAVLAGLGVGPARAAAAEGPGTSDVLLARSALAALDADPQLRHVNLVVSVVDRVAVIGGPVPTADTGKRAAWVVQRVQGIAEVKNRCFVQAGPDPLIRAVAERVGTNRPLYPDLPPIVGSAKASGPVPPPAAGFDVPPAPVEEPRVSLRPATPPVDGVLLPPVASVAAPALPPPARPAVLTNSPAAPTTAVVAARPNDVLTAATAVRNTNTKFAALTVEMRDGTLVIGGTAARAADAWEFAQALRRVPGVARVAVGQVEVR
jgi:hypothetical protein